MHCTSTIKKYHVQHASEIAKIHVDIAGSAFALLGGIDRFKMKFGIARKKHSGMQPRRGHVVGSRWESERSSRKVAKMDRCRWDYCNIRASETAGYCIELYAVPILSPQVNLRPNIVQHPRSDRTDPLTSLLSSYLSPAIS